jgi:hypothetical protein
MLFSGEMADLVLYCVQQFGVMLAVGAVTVVLIAYAIATRDGKTDETEIRFSKAVHRALFFGIGCIVVSGVAITGLHIVRAEIATVLEPRFLFKWLLIAGLIGVYAWQKWKTFSRPFVEGIIGGTWYMLFLVHILDSLTSWTNLFTLYIVFLGGFVAIWGAVVKASRQEMEPVRKVEVQKPVPVPQPQKIAPPPSPEKIAQTMPTLPQPVPRPVPVQQIVPLRLSHKSRSPCRLLRRCKRSPKDTRPTNRPGSPYYIECRRPKLSCKITTT